MALLEGGKSQTLEQKEKLEQIEQAYAEIISKMKESLSSGKNIWEISGFKDFINTINAAKILEKIDGDCLNAILNLKAENKGIEALEALFAIRNKIAQKEKIAGADKARFLQAVNGLKYKRLAGTSWEGLNFKNTDSLDLRDADLRGVSTKDCRICHSQLERANMEGSKHDHTSFIGSYLMGIKGAGMETRNECNFEIDFTDLADADLKNSKHFDTRFYKTLFTNADLQDAFFRNCNLQFADFTGANVKNAKFMGADKEKNQLSKEQQKQAKGFDYKGNIDDKPLPTKDEIREKLFKTMGRS